MASDIGMSLIVRTEQRPERAIAAIRAAVREVNPGLAIFNVKTMEEVVSDSMWQLNLYRWLIGVFAGLALVLAAIGLYGVISFGAAARLREFAVRLALGSGPRRLIQLVVARGVILAGGGLAAGIVTVRGLARTVSPACHRSTYVLVGVLLMLIALFAAVVPAVRAARIVERAAARINPTRRCSAGFSPRPVM
jgi:ABC-type antimicrobial peptide transport system permease subunit